MCKYKNRVQVVELDKNDIIVFDTANLPHSTTKAWLEKNQKILNYRYDTPISMGLKSDQTLTIIKRKDVEHLPLYTDELWESDIEKSLEKKAQQKIDAIKFRNDLEDKNNQIILSEIERLKTYLTINN